ncbi:MAG: class I tRNA ligase family protein [Candidatus Nomurabacteria bacterium]
MKNYDHKKIEKKWQKEWEKNDVYKTLNPGKTKKMYVLDMFPYPSGVGLHVGHPRGYIGSDIYARMKKMEGYNVLHPMGYDAFGLPAEQYALQHKIHPRKAVEENVKTFKHQLSIIGMSYDWSKEVNTTDPKYYKWTQWIFLEIYNSWYDKTKNKARKIDELISIFEKSGNGKVHAACNMNTEIFTAKEWKIFSKLEKQSVLMKYRLAYEGHSEVNWCKELGTVLANDEIVTDDKGNIVSERGGYPVEKKSMRQWFMRITAYADRLLSGLDTLSWSDSIKEIQKNWIGKSEGSLVKFSVKDNFEKIEVFTTRIDTIFSGTFLVIAPEHIFIQKNKSIITNYSEVEKYLEEVKNKTDEDRMNKDNKTGVELKGISVINPATNKEMPVWVADFVLGSYGTGAVFADAHDKRDFDMAKKYNIPLSVSIKPDNDALFERVKNLEECFEGKGILFNSGEFDGMTSDEARSKITEWLSTKNLASKTIKYKMRDAIFARQRYWGEPIPLKHDKDGLITDLKLKNLPLELPNVKSYEPIGTGESPLAGVKSWIKEGYETNTMPGWAGSSWYFLRYMDPTNGKVFAAKKNIDYWNTVDMYVGGAEHATGHLLYSRFWNNFLYDMDYVPFREPFKRLKNQGMILATDGRKMSKRWNNVINPDDIVDNYGADTLRVYEMFMGPFDQSLPWSTESIIGSRRFIDKVCRLKEKTVEIKSDLELEKVLHKTIKKVTEDIESMSFNTAISSMMILVNEMEKAGNIPVKDFKMFLQILAPFAPHITEELWCNLGEKKSIHRSLWPKWDKKKVVDDTIKIAVQVGGKVRGEIIVDKDITEDQIKELVLKEKFVIPWVENKIIKRIIYVKGRIVNIVI